MNGIDTQEGGSLFECISSLVPGHHGTEPQLLPSAFHVQQLAGHQSANTTKTVEDDIARFGAVLFNRSNEATQFIGQEGMHIAVLFTFVHPFGRQFSNIHSGRTEVHFTHGFGQAQGVMDGDAVSDHFPGVMMQIEDLTIAFVQQWIAEEQGLNALVVPEFIDDL